MNNLKDIGQRLKLFLETEKIRPNSLAKGMNVSRTQVYRIINGYKYGTDKFLLIIEALPKLNVRWLMSGEGYMYSKHVAISHVPTAEDKIALALTLQIQDLQRHLKYLDETVEAYEKYTTAQTVYTENLTEVISCYKKEEVVTQVQEV